MGCSLTSDSDVTGQAQFTTTTQGEAVHCGNGGHGQRLQTIEGALRQLGVGPVLLNFCIGALAQVGTSDERAPGSRNDEALHGLAFLQLLKQMIQLAKGLNVQRVQYLRTVDGQQADIRPNHLKLQVLVGLAFCHSCDSPSMIFVGHNQKTGAV